MTTPAPSAGGAQAAVRRLIVFTLLFVLVVIAATGVSGLLGRLLDAANPLLVDDPGGLALSLAFTLVAGPFAAVLWWVIWRGLDRPRERGSLIWALYVAVMSSVALISATIGLLVAAAALVDGDWQPLAAATGITWAGVWLWHRWMRSRPDRRPARLESVPTVIGSVFGILIGAGGAVAALSALLGAAIDTLTGSTAIGDTWWVFALQGLVWAAGGALVWWWHWFREGGRQLRTTLAEVALVLVVALGAVALALSGVATTLYVLLRLVVDRTDPVAQILGPLGTAIAAAAVGAVLWAYHRDVLASRPPQTRQAATLTTSGIALAAAATGIGIIVNSILAAIGTPLAESGTTSLLLAGISALAVGGPAWWLAWRPATPTSPTEAAFTGRRVYLVAVFGISAVVALVTLLVIGFRVFEFALDAGTAQGLLDRVRAPLGLLVATGLAAGYHFAIWRRDRSAVATLPAQRHTIGHVILVTGADPDPMRKIIDDLTGATVTVWHRADALGEAPSEEQLTRALAGMSGERMLVVTGPGGAVEVIPLRA